MKTKPGTVDFVFVWSKQCSCHCDAVVSKIENDYKSFTKINIEKSNIIK